MTFTPLQKRIIEITYQEKLAHLSSCLSAAPILEEIYAKRKDRTIPYLYRWTEISTGMWYVGCRWAIGCFPDETIYFTSSTVVRSLIRANPSDWKKEILCIGDTQYIVLLETAYLTLVDAKNDPMSYNDSNGHKSYKRQSKKGNSKGTPKTGNGAKGVPKTGRAAKGVPKTGRAAKGVLATGGKAKGVPKTGRANRGPATGKYAKGMPRPKQGPTKIVKCPYCPTEGGSRNMKRYHFDNCKRK